MKFFVNFLSAFRIAAAFAIIPAVIFKMPWTTFILFVLGSASDWFDGFLARKYNCCTKIGGVLDHIGDKLLVCNTLVLLAIMMPVPYVVIPVIIMIARELYISGLREFLGTQKIEMPVPKARFSMGKIKTTLQMIAISAYLGLHVVITSITPTTDSAFVMKLFYYLPSIGLIFLWAAFVASLWSATEYTFTFAKKLKQVK